MCFFRQEYKSGLPFLIPGYLPNPGIESKSKIVKMVSFMLCVFRANLKCFSHIISLNLHHSAALLPVLQMRKLKSPDCCQITKRGE